MTNKKITLELTEEQAGFVRGMFNAILIVYRKMQEDAVVEIASGNPRKDISPEEEMLLGQTMGALVRMWMNDRDFAQPIYEDMNKQFHENGWCKSKDCQYEFHN